MSEEKKKKKVSKSGTSTREKMMQRKKDLESRGNKGGLIFPKDGTTRLRIKSPGDDEEIGIEVIQFYLGQDIGGIISPATFDEPCPFMEKYEELKASKDDDDKDLAKKLVPKRKWVIGGIGYKDEKGKEIDPEKIDKGYLIPRGVYQDITDLFLDEDEWGDMTDDIEGYDIKINRSGKGQFDTTYSVSPCQKKPLDKKYRGIIDLRKIVEAQIQSYEDLEDTLKKFLKESNDDDEDDKPRAKKKDRDRGSSKGKDKKKKKGHRDI